MTGFFRLNNQKALFEKTWFSLKWFNLKCEWDINPVIIVISAALNLAALKRDNLAQSRHLQWRMDVPNQFNK